MQVFHNNLDFASNVDDIRQYTLGDPRVICRILSDNLYSNKIGSIVREISANALDAHRMSGKEDVPFDVVLPFHNGLFEKNNESFSIRDYGPGLSEDDIYALYTSYGASSKRSDDSQIGGFGIGSKSPFAYSSSFMVTSWNGGVVSKYICFLNEENSPCIKKIQSEKSSEPTGIMVEIPIKNEDDAQLFNNECSSQYCFYDVIPNGGYWKKPDIKYENEYGTLYDASWFSSSKNYWGGWHNIGMLYGRVNNSVYKLSWDGSDKPEYGMYNGRLWKRTIPFDNVVCVLKMSGSNVDLSASREELAFTDRTKKEVVEKWKAFIEKAWNDLISEMNKDTESSRFEMGMKWLKNGINHSTIRSFLVEHPISQLKYLQDVELSIDDSPILPAFVVNGDSIINMAIRGIRIYEANKSHSTGNPVLTKILKNTNAKGLLLMAKNLSEMKKDSSHLWNLVINQYSNFYLVFVNKDATFESIKEEVKSLYKSMKKANLIFHIFTTSNEDDIKAVLQAYGNPSEERIMRLEIQKRKKPVVDEVSEKKEKVKARINSDIYGGNRQYSPYKTFGEDVLYTIRLNLTEKWLSRSEIEDMMKDGYVVLVTNGPELSTKWTDAQELFLNVAGRFCCCKDKVPHKWILLNEASYSKLLSLGFAPLGAEYSISLVKKLLESIDIRFNDFLKWAFISNQKHSLYFKRLDQYYQFEKDIAPFHKNHPIVRAFLLWKDVYSKMSCNMSRVSCLESLPLKESFKSINLMNIETLKQELNWNVIEKWIESNPILQILKENYGSDMEKQVNAGILAQYIKWN